MSATSEWVSPPTRPELIESLVSGVDRYNPSNVGILEDYLYHQIRSREYDCLANLAILKLYHLASVPFPDFNLSVALLDDRASNNNMDEPDPLPGLLPYLTNLHSLLQQCRFPAFWTLYRSDALETLRDNYTVEVVGFEDSIREVAVRAVKATFQRIGSKRLGSYLDLEGVVEVPPNPDNQIASTVVQEDIKLQQLTKVISHAIPAV
ncbi:ARM repeat-containing protein [Russula vinacea]|nr:ARM repeat-containing protein [Russula vinacea]